MAEILPIRRKTLSNQSINQSCRCIFICSQSQYFARSDVALPGFAKFFSEASKEERSHAEKLMEYINKRGGDVQLKEVKVSLAWLLFRKAGC